MTAIATHTSLMTGRQLRAFARQPAYMVISLIQPVIWLFLFGIPVPQGGRAARLRRPLLPGLPGARRGRS